MPEKILKKHGYKIIKHRPQRSIITVIDGREHFDNVEADYLVASEKNRYVVIIKESEIDLDASEPALRRRLIEYANAFDVDCILLVNPLTEEIQRITFHFPKERDYAALFHFCIGLIIVVVVITIVWSLTQLKLF